MISENNLLQFKKFLNSNQIHPDYDVFKALEKEGLKSTDYIEIYRRLKRAPNRTELGMFGVMWSEHCCYRNSRELLKAFPVDGPQILVGPGENAGVVDLGESQRLVFKIESHNHPSAVEPFQGAATGVGGILRDIFTMGARPIALLNALRFGPLEDEINIGLLEGVVAGIAHYGNCVGVPTIGGEVSFNSSYTGNPLVNAMALGLMETDEIVCSGADGVDFPVLYVGSTTGRDGMGGASFASSELTENSLDDRPAVQVGDPFLEKGLIEACLQAFKSGDVIAAQDMGAAGLTCSCSEMASKGGVGIELNLDFVPAREEGMTPYEFMLSESQERMLFVIKPDSEERLIQKFNRWGLNAVVVGKVLQENIVRVIHKGTVVADLPASALADDTPIEKHQLLERPPKYIKDHWNWNENQLLDCSFDGYLFNDNKTISWDKILKKLLDSPSISSKKWIYNQYDYQVQSNTVIPPGKADAAVIRLRSQNHNEACSLSNRAIAAVVDCPDRWVFLDPERGSIAAVAESYRNLSSVGAEPLAITNNLNFASPENLESYWQLASSCNGISLACKVLETPVTGGNVSLYNETKVGDIIQPIHPTPVIGMVGLVNDLSKISNQSWKNVGDEIWLIGVPIEVKLDNRIGLAGSAYLDEIHGLITGRPPMIDLELERLVGAFIRSVISQELVNSSHDVSDGGIAVALAESCISSGFGIDVELPDSSVRLDRLLFGEGGSRILVSISPEKLNSWKDFLINFKKKEDIELITTKIGIVHKQKNLLITQNARPLIQLDIINLKQIYDSAISRRVKCL